MLTDGSQLLAALYRTRPVTYHIAGRNTDGCRDAVVLQHWTEPIEILVVRPDSAPFITFSKHVNNQLVIRITTPIEVLGSRLHVPDSTLCWATLERFDTPTAGNEAGHLIVRNGRVFSQRRTRGSDARIGGSDASTSRAHARARAHASERTRTRETTRTRPETSPTAARIETRNPDAHTIETRTRLAWVRSALARVRSRSRRARGWPL